MLIRLATPDDAEEIAALRERTIRTVVAPLNVYSPAEIDAWATGYSAALVREFIAEGNFLVAADGRVRGYGRLKLETPELAILKGIFVEAGSVGRGIGSMIVRDLLSRGRTLGAGAFELVATLNARHFYERHGFRALSVVRHATPSGGVIAGVRMRRDGDGAV